MPRKIKQKKIRRTRRGQKGGQQAEPSGSAVVTTLAGSGKPVFADGTGTGASFIQPAGVAVDAAGNVYVAEGGNSHRIRKITPGGVVTTLAGNGLMQYGRGLLQDGTGTGASFAMPSSMAIDSSGNMFVADSMNNCIRKVTSQGVVTTLAGITRGFADGTGSNAQFHYPTGVALDATGNIIVADYGNHRIRKVTPEGVVTTLAGDGWYVWSHANGRWLDGTGTSASFNCPSKVAIDSSGNMFVADARNHRIRKITPGGIVTTLAGSGVGGFSDGTGESASFNQPQGVAVDSSGNVFVADLYNDRLRRITPAGAVTTLAGSGATALAGQVTLGQTRGRQIFINDATYGFGLWENATGTTAESISTGILRAGDYATTTNESLWLRRL